MHPYRHQHSDRPAVALDDSASRVTGDRDALSEHVIRIGHARRQGAARRDHSADPDAVAEPVEHHGLQEAGLIVVDRGRPAEVTHAGARLYLRVEADEGEVLRVLKDRVSELADPVAAGVARLRPGAGRPCHLAHVAAERARAEDAMAGSAAVAAAIRSHEEEVERALADVGEHDRAGTHAWASSGAERRSRRDRDQGTRHTAERPVGRGGRPEVEQSGLYRDRAHEQGDERGGYCKDLSCKHFALLSEWGETGILEYAGVAASTTALVQTDYTSAQMEAALFAPVTSIASVGMPVSRCSRSGCRPSWWRARRSVSTSSSAS